MSGAGRARSGQRQVQAVQAIKAFEKKQVDWDAQQLGEAIGISNQQARALIATLAARGELELAEVTVRRRRLVLTQAAKAVSPRAA